MSKTSILVVIGFILTPASASPIPSFQGLGFLPGGNMSQPDGISGDGSTVVGFGTSSNASFAEAFYWTQQTGMIGLGDLPGGGFVSQAHGTSADGTVIVGGSDPGFPSYEAFRWTATDGLVGLAGDDPPTEAFGVSADGSVVAGIISEINAEQAFRWTEETGIVGIGFLPGGGNFSWAQRVSDDASTIVGFSDSSNGQRAFRWTEDDGMTDLGTLGAGSEAYDVSGDGSVIVGLSSGQAFRWTEADGMVGLEFAPGGFTSAAFGVSADGSTIVGGGSFGPGPGRATIWDEANGMQRLDQMLIDFGLNLDGWTLTRATDVSADGLTIIGTGMNPSGQSEAWIATVPEPGTLFLIGFAGLLLRRRRCP